MVHLGDSPTELALNPALACRSLWIACNTPGPESTKAMNLLASWLS